ncbi:MAG: peptidoglycan DD-metalloendopeptidase family protein [Coprococcus sp.]|nr:peptidoglycan DD-metalloendopeptidase family protein [Coprococcus sp.]
MGHPLTPEEPEIPEIPQETPEETAQSDPSEIFEDFENSYLTSAQFLAIRDRIQYNVEVPIEGLPSFITQEMIVGALKAQDEAGIPASVTIAQIIQESGFGKYGPGGDQKVGLSYLAYQYCNLFGIKGKGTAGSTLMNTFEMTDSGEIYHIQAGFRAYHTYTECIEDRTKLLTEKYADLTEGVKDANTFAMRIGSRWATDIHYGRSLIRTMKTYDLYRLDDLTLTDFSKLMGRFANPCPGSRITSTYGYRTFDNSFHKGLDLGTGKENIPTYAAEAGTVTFVGEAGSAGNLIIIDHGEGLVTKYMHHAEMYVEEGQEVEKGQQIGLSGTTGNSTGNHLHFQVEENGKAVDPLTYLQEEDEKDKEIGELRTMSRRSKFHRLKYKV